MVTLTTLAQSRNNSTSFSGTDFGNVNATFIAEYNIISAFENEARSSFIGMKHFIQNNVLRCSFFITVNVSLPSPGSILRTVTHFLFAKIQMKLIRKMQVTRNTLYSWSLECIPGHLHFSYKFHLYFCKQEMRYCSEDAPRTGERNVNCNKKTTSENVVLNKIISAIGLCTKKQPLKPTEYLPIFVT